jgi:hypothetical protein
MTAAMALCSGAPTGTFSGGLGAAIPLFLVALARYMVNDDAPTGTMAVAEAHELCFIVTHVPSLNLRGCEL